MEADNKGLKMKKITIMIGILFFALISFASAPPAPPDMELSEQAFEALAAGDYEKAEALLDVALSINPDNPYALLNLGVVYHNTGRIEKAREQYVKVILLDPKENVSTSILQSFAAIK